jgi:hypothetical protein
MVVPLSKRRHPRRRPAGAGIGVFENLIQLQNPSAAITRGLQGSLLEQPGIRLAEPTGRRTYLGTGASPVQRFSAPPSVINDINQVQAGRAINARRSLGRGRGLAPLGVPYAA